MKTKLIIIGLAAAIRVQADTNFFEILTCGADTYTNATISQVTPTYATVTYAGGVVQVPLRDLPENLQQQYHYNSNAAAQFRLEQKEKSQQLRAAEAARQAATARRTADESAKAAQFARSPAGLDAEVKQMKQAGMVELTASLIENFPEKVRYKNGWMDAVFEDFDESAGRSSEIDLGFDVEDSLGKSYRHCVVCKTLYGQNLPFYQGGNDSGRPNPLVNEISNLKHGDKVRFYGFVCNRGPLSDDYTELFFYISRVKIIETAAEKKAREQATEKP